MHLAGLPLTCDWESGCAVEANYSRQQRAFITQAVLTLGAHSHSPALGGEGGIPPNFSETGGGGWEGEEARGQGGPLVLRVRPEGWA